MSAREAFRQRVAVYAVASKRTGELTTILEAIARRFGDRAARAYATAVFRTPPTRVVEWSS